MSQEINITAQVTPNPDTIRFVVDQTLFESGTYNFVSKDQAKGSVLPETLFGIDGVQGVMVGTNFVSVTKAEKTDWSQVVESISDSIQKVIGTEGILFSDDAITHHKETGEESESEAKIKAILDSEIRPAVAMDGGDITFHSYVDGVLTLNLQGACSTCPSSVMTLKMGIENRLKEDIPDLKEIVQV